MEKNKRQIRRCSVCDKVGHNRSTCLQKFNQTEQMSKPQTAHQPLKFFVHHVNYEPVASGHIIDLKKNNIWEQIKASTPEDNPGEIYHFYHHGWPALKKYPKLPAYPISLPEINYDTTIEPIRDKIKIDNKLTKPVNFKSNLARRPTIRLPRLSQIKLPRLALKQLCRQIKFNYLNCQKKFSNDLREFVNIYLPLRRTLVSIIIFSLIIFTPSQAQTYYQNLKLTANKIAANGTTGFTALQASTSALLSGNITNAQISLSEALDNFNQAVDELKNKNKWLQNIVSVIPVLDKKMTGQQKLITAGQNISLANTYLLRTITQLQNNTSSTITNNIALVNKNLQPAIPYYQKALTDLNETDSKILPAEYQTKFNDLKLLLTAFVNDLESISNSTLAIQEIFGGQGLRRYLLVFQNPHEIRPTGGFMGSFALLEVKNGQITNLHLPAGGSYDLQGQLSEYVEPPAPMLLMNKRWHFHDANWFPDFPASAEKILWFYRHSRNITADGVIAINAEILNRILSITGPVKDEKRDLVLTSTNAITTIQKIIETGPDKAAKKPKQILSDLAPKFIEYFKEINPQQVLPLLNNLQEALTQKEIQLYFTDNKPQQTIIELGWDGKILPTNSDQDYLFVVNTNLQGQKSDAKIVQTVQHQASVQPDGSILNTVTITKEHTGEIGEEFYGQTNIDYLRLYVPQGSRLISANGFSWVDDKYFKAPEKWYTKDLTLSQLEEEVAIDPLNGTRITNEFGKTAFGNWVITQPGQTSRVYFTYKLPFKINYSDTQSTQKKWIELISPTTLESSYQIVVQKQSGVTSKFDSQIIYPPDWKPIWQQGENIQLAANGAVIKPTVLNQDKIWTIMMSQTE